MNSEQELFCVHTFVHLKDSSKTFLKEGTKWTKILKITFGQNQA